MEPATVQLWWIPLGAGQDVVRWSGQLYEFLQAGIEGRPRRDLYHSALVLSLPSGLVTIEMTPIPRATSDRGVVAEGPVGLTPLGRLRVFRYEVRRWHGGTIPDLCWSVESPVALSTDLATAKRVYELVPAVPPEVWGSDATRCGDMWNSNSVTSWLLECSGLDAGSVQPPVGGRAPGWLAGLVRARADHAGHGTESLADLHPFVSPPRRARRTRARARGGTVA
jgi:hypothetical protein